LSDAIISWKSTKTRIKLFRRIRVGRSDISSERRRSDAIFAADQYAIMSRGSSGIDSFYVRSEILFVRCRESELLTFCRNFALKDALSSRRANCQHFSANVDISTRFSRSKVELLSSKVNCRRVIWIAWLLFEHCRRKKARFRHCRWNLIVNKSYIAESRLLPLWEVSKRISTPFSLIAKIRKFGTRT